MWFQKVCSWRSSALELHKARKASHFSRRCFLGRSRIGQSPQLWQACSRLPGSEAIEDSSAPCQVLITKVFLTEYFHSPKENWQSLCLSLRNFREMLGKLRHFSLKSDTRWLVSEKVQGKSRLKHLLIWHLIVNLQCTTFWFQNQYTGRS